MSENMVTINTERNTYYVERDKLRRPRSSGAFELARACVRIVDTYRFVLECAFCGQRWSPNFPGRYERWHKSYWKCPNGCNEHAQ